ncbi:putative cytochrome P450 [Caenibius tardaugens NBRC 16725]|uniref:Putative cytochrome P450 n=1 Tax=Caenibius tardaugens NBRC 16725 TaxID=1219035 RepID=U2ZZ30_9SPHN|nr:cytochrome P450 [Caenibius tardaugens]AZI37006.1 cytochrome P450 [Caenibius tardaugens NBRC 16725]GAD47773.1 putative cytochrome P450 [Caenibius tardaugens NBRC 16725]
MERQLADGRPIVDYDHYDPALVANADAVYRHLRAEAPVAWTPHHGGFWLVSRYDDVMVRMREPDAFSSNKTYDADGQPHGGVAIPPLHFWLVPTEAEKPEWLRFRAALAPMFFPSEIARLREMAQRFCDELVDRVIEQGHCDLVKDITQPLPSLVTMHMLGLPLDEWQRFTIPLHQGTWALPGSPQADQARQGIEWFFGYIQRAIAEQRQNPRPGMISRLIDAKATSESRLGQGDRLSDKEIFALVLQVATGGVDTTTALTSNALLWLGQNPDARQKLVDNPAMLPDACEEFMRYFSPLQSLVQTATRDFELGGQAIAAGDRLMLLYGSANRDERQFADPDTVRFDRTPNAHLGFGMGMHRCIGMALARMMFSVMVTTVLKRLPDYTVETAAAQHYPSMPTVNGWISIPAQFAPGARVTGDPIIPPSKSLIDFDAPPGGSGLSMMDIMTGG